MLYVLSVSDVMRCRNDMCIVVFYFPFAPDVGRFFNIKHCIQTWRRWRCKNSQLRFVNIMFFLNMLGRFKQTSPFFGKVWEWEGVEGYESSDEAEKKQGTTKTDQFGAYFVDCPIVQFMFGPYGFFFCFPFGLTVWNSLKGPLAIGSSMQIWPSIWYPSSSTAVWKPCGRQTIMPMFMIFFIHLSRPAQCFVKIFGMVPDFGVQEGAFSEDSGEARGTRVKMSPQRNVVALFTVQRVFKECWDILFQGDN